MAIERREPSAIDPAPGSATAGRGAVADHWSRLARRVPPRLRRRLLIAALAILGAVAVAWLAWPPVRAWLHARPAYRLNFADVELDPPPPPWLTIGRQGLLDQIRRGAHLPEQLGALDVNPADLRRAFKNHSVWVARVGTIRRSFPNRLTVSLEYRQPVARVAVDRSSPPIVIDVEALVLPADQVTPSEIEALVPVQQLRPPPGLRPGRYWPGDGPDEVDPAALALATLAAALRGWAEDDSPVKVAAIAVSAKDPRADLLFVKTREGVWVRWGPPPGAEPPGTPDATAKWAMLNDWARGHDLRTLVAPRDYLEFGPDGVVRRPNPSG